ncbi:MAG: PD-(D/E)XK nuclease family protein, partial [Fusobacteriaceae bacterium]
MLEKENLILSGEVIINKYDILDQSKEKFNLFEILDLEKKEVELHSKFIYELINPQGKNPLNKLFLSLFFKNVLEKELPKNESYSIYREYGTTKYGRIDFYIKFENSNSGFAVEMKVDAGDQEKQLERYESFLKEKHGVNYTLYYLTLTGKEASEFSIGFDT